MLPKSANTVLGKGKGKPKVVTIEEDVTALPTDSDASDSGESHKADIIKTNFGGRPSEEPQQQPLPGRSVPGRAAKGSKATVNKNGTKPSSQTGSTSSSRNKSSPSSSMGSPKRKSQEELPRELGAGMADAFGRATVKKAKKNTYGSSQSKSRYVFGFISCLPSRFTLPRVSKDAFLSQAC